MISRLFVANRGEIAVRIVRACRALGVECVVGFSAADRTTLAASLADRAVCIGPAAARDSYLNVPVILAAALGTGCDALHPGYGFLAERPELAEACGENRIVFVGPSAESMRAAGDKVSARRIAEEVGVPLAPGSEEIETPEIATEVAEKIGYPVLLKASAGGGGRGMRVVRSAKEMKSLFEQASAEAREAFGDGRLFLERYFESARHVEVQVVGDATGQVIHLGDRDCSLQRRHQKIVEEAPAPQVPERVRRGMLEAAVTFARAIDYVSAGTVEFLYDPESERFAFLEDASGILTPERTKTLVRAVKQAIGDLPLELHFHNNTGLAPINYLEGIAEGAGTIHTICRPLANGVAHPSTEAMLRNVECAGFEHRVDLAAIEGASAKLRSIAEQEGLPIGQPAEYDLFHYQHQVPGGMTGTMKNQLKERGIEASLPAILEEIAKIRHELGYPVMATPFSQLIGTQAVLNLTTKERYQLVPDEILTYVLGHYGEPVGPLDEGVKDKVLSSPRAKEFRGWTPPQPTIAELRKDFPAGISDDELILRLLVPEKEIEAMRAAPPPKREYSIGKSPERTLVERLLREGRGGYVHFETDGLSVTLSR